MRRLIAPLVVLVLVAILAAPFVIRVLRPMSTQEVIVGRDGWLFAGWERRAEDEPARVASRVDQVVSTAAVLRRDGSRTIVVLVPLKARQHPDKLPAPVAQAGMNGFDALAATLHARGVEVVTAAPAFIRDDAHWTPASAENAAGQVASLPGLPRGRDGARVGSWRQELRRGDLAELLAARGDRRLGPLARTVRSYAGPAPGKPVAAVVGNSFAADYLGFGPMLSHRLGVPVDTIVRERAEGAWSAMDVYRASGRRQALVVWIVQEASFTI